MSSPTQRPSSCGWVHTVVLSLLLPLLATQSVAEDWEVAKQENGIEVSLRSVPGSDIKAFKGETEIAKDLESILATLRDGDRFHEWFPNCPESKLLERKGPVSLQYSVMDAPWPVDDRDNVLRSRVTRDPETRAAYIEVRAEPGSYPEQADRVRVQTAAGSWSLEPLGPDRTRVIFSMHLEPGGGIPAWLSNARVVGTPLEALANLRARTEAK